MHNRIEEFGGQGELILFAHANGYPPGCYRQLINQLTENHQLIGINHRALWSKQLPAKNIRWNVYADDLLESIKHCSNQPVWLMGHSLGATSAILSAFKKPELIKGLLLLDPVLLPTRVIAGIKFTPHVFKQRIHLFRKTLSRPDSWSSREEAFQFHRSKRAFLQFDDETLWDYINGGTIEKNKHIELAFSKYWEAHIYGTAPWMWGSLHKLKVPTLGVRGQHSDVLTKNYWQRWHRVQPKATLIELKNSGHLLPLEKPQETARIINDFLGNI